MKEHDFEVPKAVGTKRCLRRKVIGARCKVYFESLSSMCISVSYLKLVLKRSSIGGTNFMRKTCNYGKVLGLHATEVD